MTQTEACGTITVTVNAIVSVKSCYTITVTTPPSTTTQTLTTTVTPILERPKLCNAKGLPGANALNYDANFDTNQANFIALCKSDARYLSTGFCL